MKTRVLVKTVIRVSAMLFLLIALTGPWLISSDGVPPVEYCEAPNFVMDATHCATTLPGWQILAFTPSLVIGFFAAPFTNNTHSMLPALLYTLISLALLLPFVTTLLRIWADENRRVPLWQLGSLVAALAASAVWWLPVPVDRLPYVWGLCMYSSFVLALLLYEWIAWLSIRKQSPRLQTAGLV